MPFKHGVFMGLHRTGCCAISGASQPGDGATDKLTPFLRLGTLWSMIFRNADILVDLEACISCYPEHELLLLACVCCSSLPPHLMNSLFLSSRPQASLDSFTLCGCRTVKYMRKHSAASAGDGSSRSTEPVA